MHLAKLVFKAYYFDTKSLFRTYGDECILFFLLITLQIIFKVFCIQPEAITTAWVALHLVITLLVCILIFREPARSRIPIVLMTYYLLWTIFSLAILPF